MTDEVRLVKAECFDDVGAVQREVLHVFELLLAGLLAVAGPDRRVDLEVSSERAEHRLVRELACRAVEAHDRPFGLTRRGRTDEHLAGDAATRGDRGALERRRRHVGHCGMSASATRVGERLVGVHALLVGMDPPAVVTLVLGPHVPQARHHLLREQLRRVRASSSRAGCRCASGRRHGRAAAT